jgi:LacI family transcriptional regulator
VTLADIARSAHVSKTAVSLALNNKPGISEETRRRIMQVVRNSGYTHRSMVKAGPGMKTKQIRFLVCLKSDIISLQYNTSSFFTALIHGLEEASRTSGYALVFSAARRETLRDDLMRLEEEHPSQALILLGTNLLPEEIELLLDVQKNLVVLDTYYELLDTNFVVMNNHMGAYKAGSYLAELGHRRIGYIRSKDRMHNFTERNEGFYRALQDCNIPIAQHNVFAVDSDIEQAHQQFKLTLKRRSRPLPTAFFCECDYIAIGVIKALKEHGIRVPEDVSIIGFDNVNESIIVSPSLTTLDVEKEVMGSMAMQRAVTIVEGGERVSAKLILDTRLVERNSCREINP